VSLTLDENSWGLCFLPTA